MATIADTHERLMRLLAYHENAAATIRATMALLAGSPEHRGRAASNGHSTIASAALAAEAERLEKKRIYDRQWKADHKAGKAPRGKYGSGQAKIRRNREISKELLEKFDPKTSRTYTELGIAKPRLLAPLVRRGYLTHKGEGYIRTAKPFHVNPRDAKP